MVLIHLHKLVTLMPAIFIVEGYMDIGSSLFSCILLTSQLAQFWPNRKGCSSQIASNDYTAQLLAGESQS